MTQQLGLDRRRPGSFGPESTAASQEPAVSRYRRMGLHLGALAWFLLVAVYATWPLASHAGTHVAGNLGDPLEIAWRFAWGAHAIVHQPLHLFDANTFHPERLTLAYSENHLGVSLPVAPVFWLTGNALLAYNTEILLVLAAGGFGVYLLTWEITRSRGAAFVAGTAYTAVPFRVSTASLGHVHTLALHLAPLVLIVLLRLRHDRSWRSVAALAVLVAVAWWSSFTGALMTMVAMGTFALWEVARQRRRVWPWLWRVGAGTVAGLIAALPVFWPYVEVRRLHPEYRHPESELYGQSVTPGTYLHAPPGGRAMRRIYGELAERFRPARDAGEKELFPGFVLLGAVAATAGAAGITATRRRRGAAPKRPTGATAGFFGVLAVVAVVLSFGPRYGARPDGFPLPFTVVNNVTPGGLMRSPVRFGALALMGMAVVAGIGVSWVRPSRRRILVGGCLALLVVEFMPVHVHLEQAPARTAAHAAIAGRAGAVLGLPTIEFDSRGNLIEASLPRESQHMYLSTQHWRPITNGWGAYHPPGAFAFDRAVADIPSSGAFASLRSHSVRTVVVQTDLVVGTRWADVDGRLARWPGVRLIGRGKGVHVYDVSQAAP